MNSVRVTVTPNNPERLPDWTRDEDGLYSLDLNPKADFPISFQNDRDQEGELAIAFNATFVVEIPGTNKNRLLLEDIGNPRIFNSKLWFERSIPAIAWVKGDDRINGFLVVTEVKYLEGKPDGYDISVIEGARFWVEALKSLRINQLDLGDYAYNQATVFSEMQISDPVYELGTRNVWYPAIFRGELAGSTAEENNLWQTEDMEPVPFLKFIIDKMFEAIGFRLVSEFFNKKFFLKLGAEITENFGYTVEFTEILSAFVGYNAAQTVPPTSTATFLFDKESTPQYDPGSNYAAGQYIPPNDILVDIEISVTANFTPPFGGGFSPDITIRLRRDFDILWSIQETTDINLQVLNLELKNITVLTGQALYLDIVNPTGEPITIQQISSFKITAKKFIPRGSVVSLASYVDDRLFCWPLLYDVIKLFNMRQATDNKTRTVVLEPALNYTMGGGNSGTGFYKPTTIDWTDKINACKQFSRQLSEPKRYFNYRFVEDTNDKFANDTKLEGNNTSGRIHENRYDFLDDFAALNANGEETLQLDFFATTRQINLGPGVFVPCITDFQVYDGTGTFGFFDTDEKASRTLKHVPRILYFKGWGRKLLPTIWNFEGTEYSRYPIAFQASNILDNELNIAWDTISGEFRGNRVGMFDIFHKNYLTMRNLNGITDAFALLNELDIISLDFRDGIEINGDKYILKKVENWLANEPEVPTKVMLLLNRLIYSY